MEAGGSSAEPFSAVGVEEEGAGGAGSDETADVGSPEVVVGIEADAGADVDADADADADAEADAEAEAEAEESDEDAIATRVSQRGDVPLRFTATGHTALKGVSLVQPWHLEDRLTARRENNGAQGRCVSIALSRFLGPVATGERALETLGAWRTLYGARTMRLTLSERVQPYQLSCPEIYLNRHHGLFTRTSPPGASGREIGPRKTCQDMQIVKKDHLKKCPFQICPRTRSGRRVNSATEFHRTVILTGSIHAAVWRLQLEASHWGARVVCCPHVGELVRT